MYNADILVVIFFVCTNPRCYIWINMISHSQDITQKRHFKTVDGAATTTNFIAQNIYGRKMYQILFTEIESRQ